VPSIRITVARDGRVSAEGQDFHGPACQDRITALLEQLQPDIESLDPKPEYYEGELQEHEMEGA